jgi:hypothetical protein
MRPAESRPDRRQNCRCRHRAGDFRAEAGTDDVLEIASPLKMQPTKPEPKIGWVPEAALRAVSMTTARLNASAGARQDDGQ